MQANGKNMAQQKKKSQHFVFSCFIPEIRKWIEGASKLRFLLTDSFKQFDAP